MTTLPDQIFSENRGRTFVTDGCTGISFESFLVRAELLADAIRASGAERVCVLAERTVHYFYAFTAALLAGVTIVPLAPDAGVESRAEILEITAPGLVLDSRRIECAIDTKSTTDTGGATWNNALSALKNADLDREYLITFTSGTTSVPKGVVHSFANLWETGRSFGCAFNFGPGHVFYHHFPIAYMAGILNQFVLPMRFGCRIVVGPRFEVKVAMNFWEEAVRREANVFWMSPTMLQLLMTLDRGRMGAQYCKDNGVVILCGTAPLTVALRKNFESRYGVPVYESYGLTETLFVSTNSPRHPVLDCCSGTLLDGVRARLAADGELDLACDWMFLRYFNAENVVEADGVFHTGDLASITEEDGLFITGRKKDLIIRGGVNISPGRVERALGALDTLPEFSVFGLPDKVLGEKVALAYVAHKELSPDSTKAINEFLVSNLGGGLTIDAFIRLDSLPKNANGKVDKNKLKTFF